MSIILLLLGALMKLSLQSGQRVHDEAVRFRTEAGADTERFVPRDLIRLCQFIEVWIPGKE